jgi:hypothetical protein
VLAAAVAMAGHPQQDEPATPLPDAAEPSVQRRRARLMYIVAAAVLAAVTGAGFVLLKRGL